MALTLTEKRRANIGGLMFKAYAVTCDGSTTSITAASLDMTYIESAMLCPKAPLTGSAEWNPGSIADGDEAVQEITVSGAILGDFCEVTMSLDVTDLNLTAQVTAGDSVTAQLCNSTGGAIDLSTGTVRARISKQIGFTTRSGTYLVFNPATRNGDIFHLWVIGW